MLSDCGFHRTQLLGGEWRALGTQTFVSNATRDLGIIVLSSSAPQRGTGWDRLCFACDSNEAPVCGVCALLARALSAHNPAARIPLVPSSCIPLQPTPPAARGPPAHAPCSPRPLQPVPLLSTPPAASAPSAHAPCSPRPLQPVPLLPTPPAVPAPCSPCPSCPRPLQPVALLPTPPAARAPPAHAPCSPRPSCPPPLLSQPLQPEPLPT
ncbi:vegetative cell wall protein gp1-like [Peromyscus leucopus]|uniref:vegetative cell wall protein gp1-like n=1 Tax=Peromyscus leucopus TaxID=10041 RepID=UPI0010A14139|nr:vegetative cell wall protein gp1-like [Peromyscus leucopus]